MILLYAILFILFEAITEGLLKRYNKLDFIFKWWLQWIIAFVLFAIWFILMLKLNFYYVPIWKLICGFVFVRFMIFDVIYNLSNGQKWNYYGNKLYDKIMSELGNVGWFFKFVAGVMGIVFLMGWD